jgi:hypothetical protein
VRGRELAGANSSGGELAGGLHDIGASGEKLIAVVHGTSYSLPVPFSSIRSPVPRSACEFKSSDDGRVDGQRVAENLENSHDMAGHVSDIEILCHDVFVYLLFSAEIL